MKVSISKSKNTTIYYLSKSYRIGNKTTTKNIEKIGTEEELKKVCGNLTPLEYAKNYAREKTLIAKEESKSVIIKFSQSMLIESNKRNFCNIGYLFLQKIYYELKLDDICKSISKKYKSKFDLNEILSFLIYSRILMPSSKYNSYKKSDYFFEKPKCELQQIYRALEILTKENDFIQSSLYANSLNVIKRNTNVLYYDCTNFYFEIEEEDDFRKYGISKEHRPNPIIQMGLFMDKDGIPLSFSIFNGNENEQNSMKPLEQKIIRDYDKSNFVICTDAGLSSVANKKFNNMFGRFYITTQSIKKLKSHLKDFCLSNENWKIIGSDKNYNINELDEELYYDKIFYKERWINENGLEERLIVTYSIKNKLYQRSIRERQINRAINSLNKPSTIKRKKQNDPKRFIKEMHITESGEVSTDTIFDIDNDQILNETMYDGFYAVTTNLENNVLDILNVNKNRWEIEECFRIMKSELKARPVYLSKKERITAHFITCFISLIILKILEKKLNSNFTYTEIIETLKNMNMAISTGDGLIPTYQRNDLTDMLHRIYGFRTDYQIISYQNIKKICTSTKK